MKRKRLLKLLSCWADITLSSSVLSFLLRVGLRLLLPPALYLLARAFLLCRKKRKPFTSFTQLTAIYPNLFYPFVQKKNHNSSAHFLLWNFNSYEKYLSSHLPAHSGYGFFIIWMRERENREPGDSVVPECHRVCPLSPMENCLLVSDFPSLQAHASLHVTLGQEQLCPPSGHSHWVAVGVTTVVLGSSDISRPHCTSQPVHRIEWPHWSSRDFEWAQ